MAPVAAETVYGIYPFAGSDFGGEDRPGIHAQLIQTQGMAADKDGTIVFSDAGDHRVRRLLANGFVSQIAGDGVAGTGNRLRTPYGVAIGPAGEVYIADLGNARVLRIAKDGKQTEITGFQQPRNVAVDKQGILYVSDFGTDLVYKVYPDGTLESATTEKLKAPAGLAFDSGGSLYIADSGNQRVIAIKNGKVRTVLKDFGAVTSIAVDLGGRLYAAGGDRVAVVSPSGDISILTTDAVEVAVDIHGSLLTAARRQIRSYYFGVTSVLAGAPLGSFGGDGRPREEWRFLRPSGLVRDAAGNLFIADSDNGGIRCVNTADTLSTVASSLGDPVYFATDASDRLYFSDSKIGFVWRIEADGKAAVFSQGDGHKRFLRPSGLAADKRGQLFVADTGNGLLRKVFEDGFVSTIAGGGTSDKDGFGTSIALNNPTGIAVTKDGDVWFTEPDRLRVLRTDGKVTSLTGIPLVGARGIRFDSAGRLLIADAGAHQILRVNIETGAWEVLAGTAGKSGLSGDDGKALEATLNAPTDVWPEEDGSILIADSGNNRIRILRPMETAPNVAARIRVLNGATGQEQPIAPGELAFIEAKEAFPSANMTVRFGNITAQVLSSTPTRIEVRVPESLAAGWVEVKVGDWAVAPLQISGSEALAVTGPIENGDGSINSTDKPAPRTGTLKLQVTGVGPSPAPVIKAEISSIDIPVISSERSGSRMTLLLQLPGGFLPSGTATLSLTINGAEVRGPVNVVIR